MKAIYNPREVMCRAWEIYRMTDDGGEIKPVFSICLSMAWEHVKNKAENVINQWAQKDDGEKVQMLTACIKSAARQTIRQTTEDHYNAYNEVVAWFMNYHAMDGLVNEAYCKLAERLDVAYLDDLNAKRTAKGKQNITLTSLVYRAAKDAIRCVWENDLKHGIAKPEALNARRVQDKDGEEMDAFNMIPARDNTEVSAVLRASLSAFVAGRDDIDRAIIEGIRDGMTERQMGKAIGISGVAVHKRIVKIRAGLVAVGLTPSSLAC